MGEKNTNFNLHFYNSHLNLISPLESEDKKISKNKLHHKNVVTVTYT